MANASGSTPGVGQKRKRPALLSPDQTLVSISIGGTDHEEKQNFMLHRAHLCSHSPYFRKAFEGSFREGEEKAIHLPDVDAPTLRLFQFWLYGQSARSDEPQHKDKQIKRASKDLGSSDDFEPNRSYLRTWAPISGWLAKEEFRLQGSSCNYLKIFVRLFAFADVYDTPQLRRDVMTVLVGLTSYNYDEASLPGPWSGWLLSEMYGSLPSSAAICRFAVRRLAMFHQFNSDRRPRLERLPRALLRDIVLVSTPLRDKLRTQMKIEIRDSCCFHDHESKEEVAACKIRQEHDGAFYSSFLRACMVESHPSVVQMNERAKHKAVEQEAAAVKNLSEATVTEKEQSLFGEEAGSKAGDKGDQPET